MENTTKETALLLDRAKAQIVENMKEKGIGAILWDNSRAGFHFIPEILHKSETKDKERVARIMGLYHYDGVLYLVEEDRAPVHFSDFYTEGVDVPPVVVTLTEDVAVRDLGNPVKVKGYTTQGSLEEWLSIADCYFEALNEK